MRDFVEIYIKPLPQGYSVLFYPRDMLNGYIVPYLRNMY